MEVRIIRSPARKKTVHAKIVGETLMIYLPLGMRKEEENKLIEKMKKKIENKKLKTQINKGDYLKNRFDQFNRMYFQGNLKIKSIEFVSNQNRVRGSCTPSKGTIRISHKLMDMPEWVLDYVIMHEMSHLQYPDHSKAFWTKVGEYKYCERARGFLMAKGMEENEREDQ